MADTFYAVGRKEKEQKKQTNQFALTVANCTS